MVKERNYGIDALRLLSMLMVVGLHVFGQTGILKEMPINSIGGGVIWLFESAMSCAVNCFAIISGYLGIRSRHKATNIVTMCLQTAFWCIVISSGYLVYLVASDTPVNYAFLAEALVPQAFDRLWYISAYFCLFFFMPLLNKLLELPRRTLKISAIFTVLVLCLAALVTNGVSGIRNGYSLLWLAILYLLGAYMAKYDPLKRVGAAASIVGYLLSVLLAWGSRFLLELVTVSLLGRPVFTSLLMEYNSPTMLMAAVFLVNLFTKLRIPCVMQKPLAALSPLALGVYLIHCNPVVLDVVMLDRLVFLTEYNAAVVLAVAILTTVLVFAICLLLDYMRYLLFRGARVLAISEWICRVFERVFSGFLKDEVDAGAEELVE